MKIAVDLIHGPSAVKLGSLLYYANRMKDKSYRLPPIYLKRRGTSGEFILVDGANRLAALKKAGAKEVEAIIV
jgi:ParB-like nuclease domain